MKREGGTSRNSCYRSVFGCFASLLHQRLLCSNGNQHVFLSLTLFTPLSKESVSANTRGQRQQQAPKL